MQYSHTFIRHTLFASMYKQILPSVQGEYARGARAEDESGKNS
jgi:hypothetical protein